MGEQMQAHSESTGNTYNTWDELVEAEANGYVVAAVITDGKQSWPWMIGPYPDKDEAEKARRRLRTKMAREAALPEYAGFTYRCFVRPLWKDDRDR